MIEYSILFQKIWERTSYLEGFDKVSTDLGGKTKFGICWKWDKKYLISLGYKTEESVELLTVDHAKKIYYDKYFKKSKIIELSSMEELAMIVFDLHLHEWKGWLLVQRLCNFVLGINLEEDNICGPKTLRAVRDLEYTLDMYPDKGFNSYNLAIIAERIRTEIFFEIFEEDGDMRLLNSALRRQGHVGNKLNIFTV